MAQLLAEERHRLEVTSAYFLKELLCLKWTLSHVSNKDLLTVLEILQRGRCITIPHCVGDWVQDL